MTKYDVAIIGAGLGALTTGAILARAGRKVLVVEKSNSVGGAASSYKVGDLFVEGSLHETSDPHDPRDPKHHPLTRAGVLDAVKWIPSGAFYEVRGGPVGKSLMLLDDFPAARRTLTDRFPEARVGIIRLLDEMEQISSAMGTLSVGTAAIRNPMQVLGALRKLLPAVRDWNLSLSQKLERVFGSNEAVKTALAANLSYYHDDPKTIWWVFFALAQGSYLLSGGRYIQGGSQRLSSALARVIIKSAGSSVVLRRVVSAITTDGRGRVNGLTHTAKDSADPQTIEAKYIVGNAAPEIIASLLPDAIAHELRRSYADRKQSISLFALTLGLSKTPAEFGIKSYSTQLLPDWMRSLNDYAQGTSLMAGEPGERMPPLAIVNYATIDSGVPAPPYVLSVVGTDRLSNWSDLDQDEYRAKRARWQEAMIAYLDRYYPGLASSVVASSFNTAVSVRQYLGAPEGSVYGFAPNPPRGLFDVLNRSPVTPVPRLYLASAYTAFGGYTGVVQFAGVCADRILREG
jgi:phytoene dehydrogenase-like protein